MPRIPTILTAFAAFASAEEKVTYDDHVLPIFQQACLNCHNPDKTKGGLDLSSFSAALKGSSGGKIVEPGDTGSSLIAVVRQTAEPKMPPEGEKLGNEPIQILERWIQGGLLENKSSSARKPAKPKFEIAQRSDPAAKPDGPPPMPAHLLLEPAVVTENASAVLAIAASPWAPLIAITGQNQVLLHHAETLDLIGILPFPEGDPVSLAFTPDGRYLLVGGGIPGKSGVTVTFDVTNGSRLLSAGREFDSILAADIRPGFDIVATGGPSRLLKLWNTETGEQIQSIKKHTDWITALDISPDGVLLASGDRNGGVWVWESDTANEFHTLRAHQAAINAAVFRPDSNILATASEDGTLRFWEMNGGAEVQKIDAHPGGVTAFAFARDGSSLSAGRDFKAKLWTSDFKPARELSKKLPALPTAVALDSEGRRAFIGDARGTIHVIQTSDAKSLGAIRNNPPAINTRLQQIATKIRKQEKSIQTTKNLKKSQAALAALQRSQRHWQAAAINTRLLETRRLANESSELTENQQLEFTLAAEAVTRQATVLNRKRAQRRQFASLGSSHTGSTDVLTEFTATLAAIDRVVLRELDSLKAAEAELTRLHRSIDPPSQLTQARKLEAAKLQQAYQTALKAR